MTAKRTERRKGYKTILLILAAVLFIPAAALSFLALRAADLESAYVEKRLEGSLAAEVDLAARRVEQLTNDVRDSLARDVQAGVSPDGWAETNPMAGTVFRLKGRHLSIEAASAAEERYFLESFGDFFTRGGGLPTYDLVTRIYRTEQENSEEETRDEYSAPSMKKSVSNAYSNSQGGISRQLMESRMETDTAAREEVFEQASGEGFEVANRNVAPMAAAPEILPLPRTEALLPPQTIETPAPLLRVPGLAGEFAAGRSKVVSKSKSFAEISAQAENGLMPYISEYGLELLFWARTADGFEGCTVDMNAFKDRAADVIPDMLSDVRILTILDENGVPIIVPPAGSVQTPDWKRPYVAREISPELPRWETGAWLRDPDIFAARAGYARATVWVQVAVLAAVMLAGCVAAVRMISYEMRLASQKTTFVANVTHELKTPLTSIRLYSELLMSGKQSDEGRKREYLRTMVSETDRLAHLIDNVLSFSRRGDEKYKMTDISLSEIARETLLQLEPHLDKLGFTVTFETDGLPIIKGNREALKQVIMNLISNAEKYSGDGREIGVKCYANDGFVRADISDRGIGVPPEMTERIFREFFRADESLSSPQSGTGLGLSIARGIARRHGGDVIYSPREGGGSIFSLLLPQGGHES